MGTKYSAEVTNAVASPPVHNPVGLLGGRERVAQGNFEVATGDLDSGDIIVLTRLPANARVTDIRIYNDDLDSDASPALAAHVGIYTTGGVVKDADEFASAITQLQAAVVAPSNILCEAQDIAAVGDRLWEQAGDTEGTEAAYDIALTISAAATAAAAGTIGYLIRYVVD